jgi:hypothetical protein
MSFQLQTTEKLTLNTPEEVRTLAQKLADLGGTESEREDKLLRKMRIRAKIFGAEMTPFRWCVGTIASSQLTRRVNGQHSSEVFLELTTEEWQQVRFPVCVYWEEYVCDAPVDLAVLFEQFDPHWSARSKDDLIGAHIGVHDDLRQVISRKVARHVTGGLQWYREKVEGHKATPEGQFGLIHENHDVHAFLTWCGRYLSTDKTPEMLHPKATIAAIYHCMRDGNPHACVFWERVAGGKVVNDAETIEYKVAEFLELTRTCKVAEDWPTPIRRHLKQGKQRPSDNDIFATCLRAFAAAMKGQKVGDVFTPARNRSVPQLVAELYPGGQAPQAA